MLVAEPTAEAEINVSVHLLPSVLLSNKEVAYFPKYTNLLTYIQATGNQ